MISGNNRLALRQEIGFLFIINGVYMANILHEITPFFSENLSSIFMLIGTVLLIDVNNFLRAKLPRLTKPVFVLLVFQFLIILYISSAKQFVSDTRTKDVLYCLFSIFLILFSSTIPREKYAERLPRMLFYFNIVMLLLLIYLVFSNPNYSVGQRYVLQSGGDAITMALGTTTFAIPIYVYTAKNKFEIILKCIAGVLICICMVIFITRTAIFALFVSLIVLFIIRDKRHITKSALDKFAPLIIVIIPIVYLCATSEFLIKGISVVSDKTVNGVQTYLGLNGVKYIDESANVRLNKLPEVSRLIFNNGLSHFLFGNGYMTMYVDIPAYQIFLDMGLFGGIIYIFCLILLPLKHIMKLKKTLKKIENDKVKQQLLLFTILTIPIIIKQFVSALPYGADVYWPTILCTVMTQYNLTIQTKGDVQT